MPYKPYDQNQERTFKTGDKVICRDGIERVVQNSDRIINLVPGLNGSSHASVFNDDDYRKSARGRNSYSGASNGPQDIMEVWEEPSIEQATPKLNKQREKELNAYLDQAIF